MGVTVYVVRGKADFGEDLCNVLGEVGAGYFLVDLEGFADDAADCHPGIERADGVLKNHSDAAAEVSEVGVIGGEDIGIVEGDLA